LIPKFSNRSLIGYTRGKWKITRILIFSHDFSADFLMALVVVVLYTFMTSRLTATKVFHVLSSVFCTALLGVRLRFTKE